MTSTPVKDVNSLINFVGGGSNPAKAGGMNQAGSFGDVMSRARGGAAQSQSRAGEALKKAGGSGRDALRSSREAARPKDPVSKPAKAGEMTQEAEKAAEDAGKEMVKEIAEELGVSTEEVERAMEELGLSLYSLLDPSNLTQLVVQLGGEADQMALLMNETLFANLQNVLEAAEGRKASLAELIGVEPEEVQEYLAQLVGQDKVPKGEEGVAAGEAQESAAQPTITVEVKAGDETVKLSADENGNAVKTLEVVSSAKEENVTEEHTGGQKREGSEGSRREAENGTGNLLIDLLTQNRGQAAEAVSEPAVPFFSEQTQDIMNQIMDYMKLQLRPGMDQLEMQLHPESLGTVHIQLSSKGGEITAQFHVQNEAVKAALESQISTLQESFKEQGLKVEAVQVTVESHGFESNLWQGQRQEENAASENGRRSRSTRRINLNDLDVDALLEEEASEEDVLAAKVMEMNGNTVDYTA